MKLTNDQAVELLELSSNDTTEGWNEYGEEWEGINIKLIKERLVDTSRWSKIYTRIYQDLNTGKFYQTQFSVGATEQQDERPYEYDGDFIEFQEVKAVQKTITIYEAI